MKVFKFGGASVNNIERIKKVGSILKQFSDEKLLIVISAMGKTPMHWKKWSTHFTAEKKKKPCNYLSL